jgi:hypothetical protein
MTQLLEIVKKLTDSEQRELKSFAESLLARRGAAGANREANVSFQGWDGCLAQVHPEMSDAQFKQLIRDEWV